MNFDEAWSVVMESSLEANALFQNLVLESSLVGLEGNESFPLHSEEIIIFRNTKKYAFQKLGHVKDDSNCT